MQLESVISVLWALQNSIPHDSSIPSLSYIPEHKFYKFLTWKKPWKFSGEKVTEGHPVPGDEELTLPENIQLLKYLYKIDASKIYPSSYRPR